MQILTEEKSRKMLTYQ